MQAGLGLGRGGRPRGQRGGERAQGRESRWPRGGEGRPEWARGREVAGAGAGLQVRDRGHR